MLSLAPSLNAGQASANLDRLISRKIDVRRFENAILHLQRRFEIYTSTCPAPFVAPGLIVTPEIRRQCELYLPVAEIGEIFNKLYRFALNYPPILSSTIFHNPLSWAETFAGLPPRLQLSANPALLLKSLLTEQNLLSEFLFASFLPQRFYGGGGQTLPCSTGVHQEMACGTGNQEVALSGRGECKRKAENHGLLNNNCYLKQSHRLKLHHPFSGGLPALRPAAGNRLDWDEYNRT